jgi:hypothetical protein
VTVGDLITALQRLPLSMRVSGKPSLAGDASIRLPELEFSQIKVWALEGEGGLYTTEPDQAGLENLNRFRSEKVLVIR